MSPTSTQPAPVYDAAYFIRKFEAIPDDQWCLVQYVDDRGRRCAFGHCGVEDDDPAGSMSRGGEGRALDTLLGGLAHLINDGVYSAYKQPHPKARILAALRDLAGKEGV